MVQSDGRVVTNTSIESMAINHVTSMYGCSQLEVGLILQHLLKLLVLDLAVARVIYRPDQFLDVDGEFELFLDDAHEDLAVDVAGLVRGAADGSVGVEGHLVIFSVDFGLSLLLVQAQDLVEGDEAGVVVVQLRDQLA